MRLYQPVWEELKVKDKVTILVSNPRHAQKIKRMIIKEKDQDIVFKVANEDDRFTLKIDYDKETGVMTFYLRQWLGIMEKSV